MQDTTLLVHVFGGCGSGLCPQSSVCREILADLRYPNRLAIACCVSLRFGFTLWDVRLKRHAERACSSSSKQQAVLVMRRLADPPELSAAHEKHPIYKSRCLFHHFEQKERFNIVFTCIFNACSSRDL